MIHNSLSPLNVVLGATPRFVDWETMAYAAPEFDLADLLRFPTTGLTWPVVDQLVDTYFRANIHPERLRLAALARAIDYAGATAQQAARSREGGDTATATLLQGSSAWYLGEARTLAGELGLTGLLQSVTD
jgi:aminoglycoside phosphotransferase (APT) family kinase protein